MYDVGISELNISPLAENCQKRSALSDTQNKCYQLKLPKPYNV